MFSVQGSRALQAAVLGLKLADRTVRSDINKATRATFNPVWRAEVEKRARSAMDRRVIGAGARIAAGNPPAAVAATSRRRLSGGLVPVEQWQGWEFGADRNKRTTYQRRTKTGTTTVTRHTARQMPAPAPRGRVAYQALRAVGPRLASLWVQIIVKRFSDGIERGA